MMNMLHAKIAAAAFLFGTVSVLCPAEDGMPVAAMLDGRSLLRTELPGHAGRNGKELSPSDAVAADAAALMGWVLAIRKEEEISRRGIAVTDEEARAAVRKMLGDGQDFVRTNNELLVALPRALRRVREDPGRAGEIYDEELAGRMSRGLWLAHVAKNYTEEELAAMESHEPMTAGELENVALSVRPVLAERKLRDAVCGDAENRKCVWDEWCLRQVLEADVSIPDDALRTEFEKVLSALAAEHLAASGGKIDKARPR